jgi:hypothetical protein
MTFFSRLFGRKPSPPEGPAPEPPPAPVVRPPPIAREVLRERLSQQWGIRIEDAPEFQALAAEWAAIGSLEPDVLGAVGAKMDAAAASWSSEARYFRILGAARTVDGVLEHVPNDLSPTRAAMGFVTGEGAEPLLFAAIGLAMP